MKIKCELCEQDFKVSSVCPICIYRLFEGESARSIKRKANRDKKEK